MVKFDDSNREILKEIEYKGSTLWHASTPGDCFICHEKTYWIDIHFECFICSEECEDKIWSEYEEAERKIANEEARQ